MYNLDNDCDILFVFILITSFYVALSGRDQYLLFVSPGRCPGLEYVVLSGRFCLCCSFHFSFSYRVALIPTSAFKLRIGIRGTFILHCSFFGLKALHILAQWQRLGLKGLRTGLRPVRAVYVLIPRSYFHFPVFMVHTNK